MPKRSKVELLPRALRDELNKKLVAGAFANYNALEKWLAEQGAAVGLAPGEIPKRSALHRYGANLERKLAAIKASTEAAALIAREAPDDADQRSAAVISLIQTEVFEVLVALQEASESDPMKRAKLLAQVAKNVATLTRASVTQKKWEQEIRAKVNAAADRVAAIAKKGGASKQTVDEIWRAVTGIVPG